MTQLQTIASDGLVIRPLALSDSISDLTHLLHRAYARRAAQGLRYMATHQSDDVTRERANSGKCFVAFDDDVLVGTILFKPAEKTSGCAWYDRPEVASIAQFGVEPSIQATGLGRRLMAHVIDYARGGGEVELALDTAEPATDLINWYTRLGFRFIEYAQWGHTNYRSVILSLTL